MIKAMGGRMSVESREGVGTRFTVTLPLAEAASLFARSGDSGAATGTDTHHKNEKVA